MSVSLVGAVVVILCVPVYHRMPSSLFIDLPRPSIQAGVHLYYHNNPPTHKALHCQKLNKDKHSTTSKLEVTEGMT